MSPVESKDTCFVIMPFGGWVGGYYESIYAPAIKAAGLEPHRADDLNRPSTIVHDIWEYTKAARLLLADLTERNPNVFYELGLAHAIAKPAILVADSIEAIPFDLRHLRVIVYNKNDPGWGSRLGASITSSVLEVLKSPKASVLPAFLNVASTAGNVSKEEKAIIEIKQDLEMLRRELRRSYDARIEGPREIRRELLHHAREFEALRESGMSPMDILRASSEVSISDEVVPNEILSAPERRARGG